MPNLKVSISANLFDRHGKLIRKYRPRVAHSFLAQFIELLYLHMSQGTVSVTQTNGVEESPAKSTATFQVNLGASSLLWGMLIGSGDTAVDIDDHALESIITSDLTVSAHTFVLSYPTASSRRLSISRTFINALASPMAIEEVALYTMSGEGYYFCLDRTLYSVAIPASSSLELTYRITVSV